MSVPNSPRMSRRSSVPDPHSIDLPWALGRARDWLLGPTPLIANLSLLVFATIGTVLWRISQDPDGLALPGWAVVWGVLVAIHAGLVVIWGTLHAWRTPRRRPVYYRDIPTEQRSSSRSSRTGRRTAPQSPAASAAGSLPTWQGVLAPVTPFPTLRGADPTGPARNGTELPAAPDHADVTVVHQTVSTHMAPAAAPSPARPAPAARDSALADVRDVLASDQPLWRRWRRRTVDRTEPAPLPIEAADSWLAPFPGSPPVTRPALATPPSAAGMVDSRAEAGAPLAQGGDRWPASATSGSSPAPSPDRAAEADQIPSLAAMLRSSNMTSMADAPISTGQPRPGVGSVTPAEMPEAPGPLARRPGGGPPQPMALFAAFGIDGDGKPTRPASTEDATDPAPDAAAQGPRRPEPLRPRPR